MIRQKNRRENYFIKKKFQNNFILKFCALVVLGSLISGIILYLFSRDTLTTAFVNSRLSIVSTANYILPALVASSLVTIFLIGIATAIVVMYHSHRIAGPLFKVERSARDIGAGDLTVKIKLRSTDEMAKLADCFNGMRENINIHLSEIKAKSGDLGNEINNLLALGEAKPSLAEQIQEELEKLSRKKEELDRAIDYFRLEDNK